MGSFVCAKEPLVVGEEYVYREADDDKFIQVELVKDESDKDYYRYTFKILGNPNNYEWLDIDKNGCFRIEMATGDFYYPGMPRIWDKDEYY